MVFWRAKVLFGEKKPGPPKSQFCFDRVNRLLMSSVVKRN